jgi:pimeloyl-ACP methyl ester carboxylesterase
MRAASSCRARRPRVTTRGSSRCSSNWAARKRALAAAFWSTPNSQTWQAYWTGCRHLYNTRIYPGTQAGERVVMREDILCDFIGAEMPTMDFRAGLAGAQCPVLVLAGEQDPVCTVEDARDIAALLPAHLAGLVTFAGAGLGVWRDDPEPAFQVLRRFVGSLA